MSDQPERATSVSGRVPRLQSFLDEDRMVLDVRADDLGGAVGSLVECLVRNGITTAEDAPNLVAKVVARDSIDHLAAPEPAGGDEIGDGRPRARGLAEADIDRQAEQRRKGRKTASRERGRAAVID